MKAKRSVGNRPVCYQGCPAVGFCNVRKYRCENRLARVQFLQGWGGYHPGAPVSRLALHAQFKFRSFRLCTAVPGTVIVFIDRMQRLQRHGANRVMAHVLVHEITHIIQRIGRHSHTGIMKASWNDQDYFEMASKPLSFGQEDVALI